MNRLIVMLCSAAAVAAVLVGACNSEQPIAPPPPSGLVPPYPQSLSLKLMGGASDDGAIMLEVRGPSLKLAMPGDTTWYFSSKFVGDTLFRAVIVGTIGQADLMTIQLGNSRGYESAYRVTVLDVADQLGDMRPNLQNYDVRIAGNYNY